MLLQWKPIRFWLKIQECNLTFSDYFYHIDINEATDTSQSNFLRKCYIAVCTCSYPVGYMCFDTLFIMENENSCDNGYDSIGYLQ